MALIDAIQLVEEKLDPEKLQGMTASYQFMLSGDEGGNFYLELESGRGAPEEGTLEDPDLTVSVDIADFLGLLKGELNPMTAFMSGKIKVEGDMTLAMKLQKVIGK